MIKPTGVLSIILVLFYTTMVCSQSFDDIGVRNLKGGYLGFASFVDYNNDGYDDVFVTGLDFDNRFDNNQAVFYRNNGDHTFTESTITTVPRVIYGDYDWADFDNNGTLDFLYSGTTSGFSEFGITKVFRNSQDGCEFAELPLNLPGVSRGASRWADINGDGILDIFLAGNDINDDIIVTAYIGQNNDNFTQQTLAGIEILPGGRGNGTISSARWADFDADGLNDVLIAISTELGFYLKLYRNLGGFQFEEQDIGLPQLSYVAMELGDVNNDGLIDLVFTGSPNLMLGGGDGTGDFYVFTNNGNMNFTNSFTIPDEGVFQNDIALGDIDNDGFLDAINYGTGPWGTFSEVTKIYRNNQNGTFSDFNHNLPDCRSGGVDFGDFDNDNDLDILYFGRIEDPFDNEITYIYENTLVQSGPTEILADEGCACDNTVTFSLNDETDSVQWSFGDPLSGALNISNEPIASHTFSGIGIFTVTANYTVGGTSGTLSRQLEITGLPQIQEPSDVFGCDDGGMIEFDFNSLKDIEILNGASPATFEVLYYESLFDAQEDIYRIEMPYSYDASVTTIHVRVQNTENPQCFVLTNFQIALATAPQVETPEDLEVCDDNGDGFGIFDLTAASVVAASGQTNVSVSFYDSMGNFIPLTDWSNYENSQIDSDVITVRLTDDNTLCFSEIEFSITVNPEPLANPIPDLIGCDEDGDGISEFFDTSAIESIVLGSQENMVVTYFDSTGNSIALTNPYTNIIPNQETLTARVTNTVSGCFAEADFVLRTSESPSINTIDDLRACEIEEGFALFDTSQIIQQLIGNQVGLMVTFLDAQGIEINDFISLAFRNQTPFEQTINVVVTNEFNSNCTSESSFLLVTSTKPDVGLEERYSLCDLDPSIVLDVPQGFQAYEWLFEDGTLISSDNSATITEEGSYMLNIEDSTSGTNCEWTYSFELLRSDLPTIQEIKFSDLSGSNFIRILADGDGDFEYSIDGTNYFDNNQFTNVIGGSYTVYVRDKDGCGEDSETVILLDYPRFFSPNGDNVNETWHIFNPENFPDLRLEIFDRYGKLLVQLRADSNGWDGTFNGLQLPSSDYWFNTDLGSGRTFSGHFALKR